MDLSSSRPAVCAVSGTTADSRWPCFPAEQGRFQQAAWEPPSYTPRKGHVRCSVSSALFCWDWGRALKTTSKRGA